MATYKEIQGYTIQDLSSDSTSEGQVFYNTTDNKFKLATLYSTGAFATGGNLTTARSWPRGFGTYTAGVAAGGTVPPYQQTEEYDGTSWTGGGNMGTGRMRGATGGLSPQTAGIYFGGRTPPGTLYASTEEYDGSSWTGGGAMPATRDGPGGAGTQTAALAFGGKSGTFIDTSIEYDGSSWTAGGTMGTAIYNFGSAGSQTSGLGFGGENAPTPTNITQSYNGSSWTAGGTLNTSRYSLAGAGTDNESAIAFGGASPPGAPSEVVVEMYDGSSWTNTTSLPSHQSSAGGFGTTTNAVTCGGYSTPGGGNLATTFEWSGPGAQKVEDIDVT